MIYEIASLIGKLFLFLSNSLCNGDERETKEKDGVFRKQKRV